VKEGKSIDTTMGFTPLEGLMMDTRSGTIDPGVILYLLKKKKGEEISQELYYKSGLLGISGDSSDMRDIIEKASGNSRCQLALEIYLHRLCSCIGSMIASLQGIDVLVFTAGIGENSSEIRKKVCEHFSFLGIKLDEKKNSQELTQDCELSASKIKVLVIHAGETFEIARECMKKLI
jgi:acetate kinase